MPKIIYLIIGSIALCLGVVGIIIPILPSTPFLLLTSFCFAKGSQRFHDWFVHTKIYQKHLLSFVSDKSMLLRTKVFILTFASVMLIFPLLFSDSLIVKGIIICLYVTKYYYFIFRIKTL